MTSIPSIPAENLPPETGETLSQIGGGWAAMWHRVEGRLETLVDRANPILVKETRQALKSRQFFLTFFIVLIACWIVSFAGVVIVGPEIYYVAAGSQMMMFYYAILAFPLAVIVPYSAFRSLASEQEENTYDLLSITTLTPQQIISGKLGSAAVQMVVYLSAVSPCIAFTFLLRGVDALSIAFILFYTVLGSMGLSMLALLAGTLAKVRYTQVIVSVALVLGLAGVCFSAIGMTAGFLQWGGSLTRQSEFWIPMAGLLTFFITTFALLHTAAAAMISFPSENRSTPLRRLMLLQQACFVGWMAVPICFYGVSDLREVAIIGCIVTGIYWYFAGTLLTSEWPLLSRRVQRSLPQSTTGRSLLTWLNPGPGTGFMFCVANLFSLAVCSALLVVLTDGMSGLGGSLSIDESLCFLLLGMAYFVLFLGTGRLLIKLVRRFMFVSMLAGFLLHVVLLLAGCGLSLVFYSLTWYSGDWSLLQLSNPLWTLGEVLDGGMNAVDMVTTMLLVSAAALIVFFLNLRSVAIELSYQRAALPQRVVEEEAELHPEPVPGPRNPWEEEAGESE